MTPASLERTERGLRITWSDSQTYEYTARRLRDACPCATCREKHGAPAEPELLPVLTPEEARPLRIERMRPAGLYAYAIAFSDGHHSGLYPLQLLRELGEPVD